MVQSPFFLTLSCVEKLVPFKKCQQIILLPFLNQKNVSFMIKLTPKMAAGLRIILLKAISISISFPLINYCKNWKKFPVARQVICGQVSLDSTYKYMFPRHLLRFFDYLAHPNPSATLASDQK